jgi:hypothetical protein
VKIKRRRPLATAQTPADKFYGGDQHLRRDCNTSGIG